MRRWMLAVVAALIALGVGGALVPGKTATVPMGEDVTVYTLRGPIHTDFVVPLDATTKAAFSFADLPERAQWVIVGWGSRAFYTTTGSYADLSAAVVWRAATGDEGVLRLLPVPQDAPEPGDWADQRLLLSDEGYDALLTAMTADVTGPALPGVHLTPGDAFFPTTGRFSILRSCNQWAGEVLRAAGLRTGVFTATTGQLRLSLWWFGHSSS